MELTNAELHWPVTGGGKKCMRTFCTLHSTDEVIFRTETASFTIKRNFVGLACLGEGALAFSKMLAHWEIKAYYWLTFYNSLLQWGGIHLVCSLPRGFQQFWLDSCGCQTVTGIHEQDTGSLSCAKLKTVFFTSLGCLLVERSLNDLQPHLKCLNPSKPLQVVFIVHVCLGSLAKHLLFEESEVM